MAIDVHVLGTASARPTPDRAVSGSLVKGPDGIAVIDAGEGFQTRYARQRRRLKKHASGETLKPSSVNVLAFTHGHLDHTWGALPWLQSMDLERRQQPCSFSDPRPLPHWMPCLRTHPCPTLFRPQTSLASGWRGTLGGNGLTFPIRWVLGDVNADRWVELDPQTGGAVLLEGMPQPEGWANSTLMPVATAHTVPSCGWMIQQHATAGKFDRARADDLGLTTKERAQLARGENVARDNGELLEAVWFRGGKRAPVSVLISGDTASRPNAWDDDVAPTLLIHESTFLNEQQDKADQHQHSTAAGAVASARAVGASCLALTHYSNRIKSSKTAKDEASDVADGLPVVALNDNDRMVVDDLGSVHHLVWSGDGWSSLNIKPNR